MHTIAALLRRRRGPARRGRGVGAASRRRAPRRRSRARRTRTARAAGSTPTRPERRSTGPTRNERYLPDVGRGRPRRARRTRRRCSTRVERWDEAADVYGRRSSRRASSGAPEVQQLGAARGPSCGCRSASTSGRSRRWRRCCRTSRRATSRPYRRGRERRAGAAATTVADALAASLARQDDWDGVLRALDRASGLRGRYRAALRPTAAGRELLALERELDAAARGAPDGAPARGRAARALPAACVRGSTRSGSRAVSVRRRSPRCSRPARRSSRGRFPLHRDRRVAVAPGDDERPAGRSCSRTSARCSGSSCSRARARATATG